MAPIRSEISIDVCVASLTGQDIIDFAEEIKRRNGAADKIHCDVKPIPPDREKGTFFVHYDVILTHKDDGIKRPKLSEFGSLAGNDPRITT